MSAKSEKSKNVRVRLVGGGFTWSRSENGASKGGSMKAARRAKRKLERVSKKR